MARVKRGVTAHARHKKVLGLAKGYRGRSKDAFRVAIEKVDGPNKGSKLAPDVACLAEAVLYFKNKAFGGKQPLSKLRYDKYRDLVLGRWSAAPLGAPEGFMVFALDGTWEWTYVPMMGGNPATSTNGL